MEKSSVDGQTPKVLDLAGLKAFKQEKDRSGILYLSRIPPLMGPQELRAHLMPFGPIQRIYMTPGDARKQQGGGRHGRGRGGRKESRMFIDGWLEFSNKADAKNAALALNGTCVGGNRRAKAFGELWNIKYLAAFKWSNLTEQIAYERAVREQRMRAEVGQASREAGQYLGQVERAQEGEKIAARRRAKGGRDPGPGTEEDALEAIRKRFRQRKPIQPSRQ